MTRTLVTRLLIKAAMRLCVNGFCHDYLAQALDAEVPMPKMELNSEPQTRKAFDDAIAQGRLSLNRKARNWVGHFMFMGFDEGKALFKHYDTRIYID